MPSFTLTDATRNLWVNHQIIRPHDFDLDAKVPWSVTKRTLRGGRRDGVDLIEVDNGAFSFSVVPTRGMGIWKGNFQGRSIGWESPVKDGPVNPAYINLMNWGGLGWLEGFDELLAAVVSRITEHHTPKGRRPLGCTARSRTPLPIT